MKKKRILVDMSATIIHHGHIRLLKKASRYGKVIVALTRDIEVKKNKGYYPELNFKSRKEILSSIKYVDRVISSNFLVNERFLKKNKIDILIHGTDSPHSIKNKNKLIILPRTRGISSSKIRKRVKNSLRQLKKFRGKW